MNSLYIALVACVLSMVGSLGIIVSYIRAKEHTIEGKLIAWLSFNDFCLCIMQVSELVFCLVYNQQVFEVAWYPVTELTNFFVISGWIWVAVIAFASYSMESTTTSNEAEARSILKINILVWGLSFIIALAQELYARFVGGRWVMATHSITGVVVYVWSFVILVVLAAKLWRMQKEVFAAEKKKVRFKVLTLLCYLIPFLICWSFYVFIGFLLGVTDITVEQIGPLPMACMITMPPLQGAVNAIFFGLLNSKWPRDAIQRVLDSSSELLINTTEKAPVFSYDEEDSQKEQMPGGATTGDEETKPLFYGASVQSYESFTSQNSLSQVAAIAGAQKKKVIPPKNRSSVLVVYLNSFIFYFSMGALLMAQWEYVEFLGGAPIDYGLSVAAFGLGFCIAAVPLVLLSNRFATKPVLLVTTFASAVGSVLWIFAQNPAWIIASRFLEGIGGANIVAYRNYLAVITSRDIHPELSSNSNVAFAAGSIGGPAVALAFIYAPIIETKMGSLKIHFNPYTDPGWLLCALQFLLMVTTWFFLREPKKSALRLLPARRPSFPFPVVICVALLFGNFFVISFFEALSIPILRVMFGTSDPITYGFWVMLGVGSLLVQLVVVRVMTQLELKERLGVSLGGFFGFMGAVILMGYTPQNTRAAMVIGGVLIVCVSGTFVATFCLTFIAKHLGKSSPYMGHVLAIGISGRIFGPIWAVTAATNFSSVHLQKHGLRADQINTLVPFAGASVVTLLSFLLFTISYNRITRVSKKSDETASVSHF